MWHVGDGNDSHVSLLDTDNGNGETLQFTTGEKINITVIDLLQLCKDWLEYDGFPQNKTGNGVPRVSRISSNLASST